MVIRFDPEDIAFAGPAQSLLDIADAIHRVRSDPGKWYFGCQRTLYHLNSKRRLGGERDGFGHMSHSEPGGITGLLVAGSFTTR